MQRAWGTRASQAHRYETGSEGSYESFFEERGQRGGLENVKLGARRDASMQGQTYIVDVGEGEGGEWDIFGHGDERIFWL